MTKVKSKPQTATDANTVLPAVALTSRWHEILGSKPNDIPYEIRRQRWEEWKSLGMKAGKRGKEMVNYWSKDNVDETCFGCKWRDGDWCKESELPCNVNPILTINGPGIIGMACCGTGYEPKQLDMFEAQP